MFNLYASRSFVQKLVRDGSLRCIFSDFGPHRSRSSPPDPRRHRDSRYTRRPLVQTQQHHRPIFVFSLAHLIIPVAGRVFLGILQPHNRISRSSSNVGRPLQPVQPAKKSIGHQSLARQLVIEWDVRRRVLYGWVSGTARELARGGTLAVDR